MREEKTGIHRLMIKETNFEAIKEEETMTAFHSHFSGRSAGCFRKALAALLVLMVFLSSAAFAENTEATETEAATSAASTSFTEQPYADYPTLFYVDHDESSGLGFIGTLIPAESFAFTHVHENENLFSLIQSDILVLDATGEDPYPVLRTWLYYAADDPQNIQSVTFFYGDHKYTFTGIGDSSRNETTEKGTTEKLVIQYGQANSDFLSQILVDSLVYLLAEDENKVVPEMKMILHGDEDIEATVPEAFWQDFALLVLPFTNNDYAWLTYIARNEGTPCTVE